MKKLLALIVFGFLGTNLSAQIIMNEINPDNSGAQFIELYNSNSDAQGPESLDCYTLIIVNNETGPVLNVLNFSSTLTSIPAGGLFLLNNTNWSSTAATYTRYTFSGTAYSTPIPITGPSANNILITGQNRNAAFLFKNGILVDVLVMKDNLTGARTFVASIPNLNVPAPCTGSGFTADFDQIATQISARNVVPSVGNGCYARVSDGPCYGWNKRSGARSESPGTTNGLPQGGESSSVFTAPSWTISSFGYDNDADPLTQNVSLLGGNNTIPNGSLAYDNPTTPTIATVTVTIGSFNASALDLNINVRVWEDLDGDNVIDEFGADADRLYEVYGIYIGPTATSATRTFQVPVSTNRKIIEVVTTPGTCYFTSKTDMFTINSNLPVTLKGLKVSSNNKSNSITWTTSTEQNNKGFEVQRALGNTNDFKTIGFVGTRAKDGNSQIDINYSFDDANIVSGQVHNYRLKQIDFDGKFSMSPVRSIKPGSIESNLNVYPNPSQGTVTVNTGSATGKLNIYVLDNTGRTINQYLNVSTSNTRISNLKKGLYTLKIVNTETGEQSAQRVVVQ